MSLFVSVRSADSPTWLVIGPAFTLPDSTLEQTVYGTWAQELAAAAHAEVLSHHAASGELVDVRWTVFGTSKLFTLQVFCAGKWRNTPVRATSKRNLRPQDMQRMSVYHAANSGNPPPVRVRWYDGPVSGTLEELDFHARMDELAASWHTKGLGQ